MIAVAGGTGRLGRRVVASLLQTGSAVRVLTRDEHRAAALRDLGAEVTIADVRDSTAVEAAVAGASTVLSMVHGFAGPGAVTPASVDRDGNRHLIDAAANAGADVVLMSVVGASADSPMELFRMKRAAEDYLAGSGVPGNVVRATAYAELWIELLRQTARRGRPVVFGRGANPVNFVSVRDVAALVTTVTGDRSARGQTLSIGGPQNLTFDQLAALVQEADGRSAPPRHVPRAVLRGAAHTIGRLRPVLGRQLTAALEMDTAVMTFDGGDARDRYAGLPDTTVADVLRRDTAP